ncbi:cytochrome b-c1 complex subunit 2 [Coccidioides immitis RMSCC 3703]|uniref:Cytochrome b-c1 complex subunit 2, mitochondrial n=1 Tax=Coccidioides immitis RMSCC 3703 TaxID=454286 RepID=A0A0J8TJN8_COCIT|nr:cytochrome b-c1 complex subunit 2 [Coccidioides immitis RMSCC 3703]
MLSRTSFGRQAVQAFRKQCLSTSQRGMASAAAPKGYDYETTEAAGVKLACRDFPAPTTTLTVVAKAGSRYQPLPGYSDALANFAFKSTTKRSALRITRESELLGGQFSAYHSRENVVLTTKFLSADLPYYAELLAEVLSNAKYSARIGRQPFAPSPRCCSQRPSTAASEPTDPPLLPAPLNVDANGVAAFTKNVYTKATTAVISNGANASEVSKWVGQFFSGVPASPASGAVASEASKYFGGEQRIASQAGNAMVIAFPGSSSFGTNGYKPEFNVLAALLGGQSTIKWSTGSSLLSKAVEGVSGVSVSAKQATYSDAGLFHITISGQAESVAQASKSVVETIKKVASGNIASEDIKKAIALARFRALECGQNLTSGVELTGSALVHGSQPFQIAGVGQSIEKVTEQQVKEAAKSLLAGKASVASVGDLFRIPYASELGLTV